MFFFVQLVSIRCQPESDFLYNFSSKEISLMNQLFNWQDLETYHLTTIWNISTQNGKKVTNRNKTRFVCYVKRGALIHVVLHGFATNKYLINTLYHSTVEEINTVFKKSRIKQKWNGFFFIKFQEFSKQYSKIQNESYLPPHCHISYLMLDTNLFRSNISCYSNYFFRKLPYRPWNNFKIHTHPYSHTCLLTVTKQFTPAHNTVTICADITAFRSLSLSLFLGQNKTMLTSSLSFIACSFSFYEHIEVLHTF